MDNKIVNEGEDLHTYVKEKLKASDEAIKKKLLIDKIFKNSLLVSTVLGAAIIVVILLIIITNGIAPFLPNYKDGQVNFYDFITGTKWSPNKQIFGVGYMIINTLYITLLSVILIVPISILTALFISKVAPKRLANIMRTVVEILASIPSVLFGLVGAALLIKYIDNFAKGINKLFFSVSELTNGIIPYNPIETVAGLSTLAAVLVLSMMIFPTITSIAETSIRSVPKSLEEASLALGATKVQTNFKVVLTSAKSGIFAGVILGVGRALGEATAVSLVAGNLAVGPTLKLFSPTQTLTSAMLLGIHESEGLSYDIRYSVALVLMVLILIVNAILNLVKEKVGNMNG
jgi:phosphate transport system permease protein